MSEPRPIRRSTRACLVVCALILAATAVIAARPSPPTVGAVDPDTVSAIDPTPIAIHGSDFDVAARLAFAPGGPSPVASIPTGGEIGRVRLDGDRLLVAAGSAGLVIVDVGDPARPGAPRPIPLPGPALDVALGDDTLWVAAGEAGVFALPRDVDALARAVVLDVESERVFVDGDRLYVATRNRLTVVDVSDPSSPVVAGELVIPPMPDPYRIRDMLPVEGRLYLAVTRFNRPNPGIPPQTGYIGVVDVDAPSAPHVVLLRNLDRNALALVRRGDRVYVAGAESGPTVVDVSSPDDPVRVPFEAPAGRAEGVALHGGALVVATTGSGLQVYDLADDGTPAPRAERAAVEPAAPVQNPGSVVVARGVALVAAGSRVDVFADLGARTPDGTLGTLRFGGIERVALRDGIVFGVNPFNGAVAIDGALVAIDVSDPSSPRYLDGTFVNSSNGARDIVLVGDHAFVAAADAVAVVSTADPSDLVVTRQIPFPGFSQGVAAHGGRLFVVGGGVGLRIYDLADPADPTETGTLPLPGFPPRVAVAGDHAYVAGGLDGLHIVDVRDATAPALVTTLPLGVYAADVAVTDGHAFVGAGPDGVLVVDVSDPAAPRVVGTLSVPRADGLAIVDGRLLVGGFFPATAYEFDVRQPASPIATARYRMSRFARAFAIEGDMAAAVDLGVTMLRLGPFPTDVDRVSAEELRATAPAGLLEGDYDAVVVNPDGAAGRGFNAVAACAPVRLDAQLVRGTRGYRVAVAGDPALFRPDVRHDARLLLPVLPVVVVVQVVAGRPDEATLRIEGAPPRVSLSGPDAGALRALWASIVENGGVALRRANARSYGPFDLDVSRAGAPAGGGGDIRPLGLAAGPGAATLVAELRDGHLVSARIKGPGADAEIAVRVTPQDRCIPGVLLRWSDVGDPTHRLRPQAAARR